MFFFFKQKTAYEMRISDWSSDVCSSDLVPSAQGPPSSESRSSAGTRCSGNRAFQAYRSCPPRLRPATSPGKQFLGPRAIGPYVFGQRLKPIELRRSEEHTSELQSLMRISYAVFCLKKKKIQTTKVENETIEITEPYSQQRI